MTHSRFNFRLDFIRHFQMFINDLHERDDEWNQIDRIKFFVLIFHILYQNEFAFK